jgi:hypothetical protein
MREKIHELLTHLLGRKPTAQEVQQYAERLNARAEKHVRRALEGVTLLAAVNRTPWKH